MKKGIHVLLVSSIPVFYFRGMVVFGLELINERRFGFHHVDDYGDNYDNHRQNNVDICSLWSWG